MSREYDVIAYEPAALISMPAPTIRRGSVTHEAPHDHHAHCGRDAARRHHQARGDDRIVEQPLEQDRLQHQAPEKPQAEGGHGDTGDGEVAVLEDAQVEEGVGAAVQAVPHEADDPHDRGHRREADVVGAEPILLRAAVEHVL
jgi:hypothetical protein